MVESILVDNIGISKARNALMSSYFPLQKFIPSLCDRSYEMLRQFKCTKLLTLCSGSKA